MIVTQKENHFEFKRENWKEYFQIFVAKSLIRNIKIGTEMPRFYLPIWGDYVTNNIECWIFPLAPFVLAYRILEQMLWILWKDLFEWLQMLKDWRANVKNT